MFITSQENLWCGSLSHRYFCAKKTHVTKNSQFLIPLVKMLLLMIQNFWQKFILRPFFWQIFGCNLVEILLSLAGKHFKNTAAAL